jgi:hypothetical protein
MPRKSTENLHRIQLDMPERAFDKLKQLQTDTGAMSVSETIRDALVTREQLVKAQAAGAELWVQDEKTGERFRLIFPH